MISTFLSRTVVKSEAVNCRSTSSITAFSAFSNLVSSSASTPRFSAVQEGRSCSAGICWHGRTSRSRLSTFLAFSRPRAAACLANAVFVTIETRSIRPKIRQNTNGTNSAKVSRDTPLVLSLLMRFERSIFCFPWTRMIYPPFSASWHSALAGTDRRHYWIQLSPNRAICLK